MTQQEILLVQRSWQEVAELDAAAVGHLFYTRLFECHPELTRLFRQPVADQSKKLLQMMAYIIAKLNTWDDLAADLQKLSARHLQYGVKEKHYDMVGEALLWTLEKAFGARWDKSLEGAWVACYTQMASAMIDASQEAALV